VGQRPVLQDKAKGTAGFMSLRGVCGGFWDISPLQETSTGASCTGVAFDMVGIARLEK
jgi:hypothetical protein